MNANLLFFVCVAFISSTASCATTYSACQGPGNAGPPQTGTPCAEPARPGPTATQEIPHPAPGNPMPTPGNSTPARNTPMPAR